MAREMKDGGIEWIGDIPVSWAVLRGKNILTLLERPVLEADGVITCFRDGMVTLRSNRREDGFTMSDKEIGYQGIDVGDLVVHGMDGFAGAIGISDSRGKATPVLNVMDSSQNKRFLMYYLRSAAHCGLFLSLSTGIRVRSCDTNWNKIKNVLFALPTTFEQQRIVSFLDTECARIDAVIEQTRASIEEYKKLKQAVITQAVTKGIRPNRPMKDSGIEWIGEIPFEWNTISIGRLFSISAGGDAKPEFYSDVQDEEHPYPVYTNSMSKNQVYAYTSKPIFEKGTVTVTGRGAIGTAFYRETPYDAIIRLLSLRPKLDLDGRFYAYWISNVIHFFTDSAAVGQLSAIQMASYKTIYCQKEEQSVIAEYLDAECSKIDILISKKGLLLSEIELYKKSLIYEYVTGKKDVLA